MYAITGITGQVGSIVARDLLASGQSIRAIVRDVSRADSWAAQGAEVAVADMHDATALAHAFTGAEAVFILIPPHFDPSPDFAEARSIGAAVRTALLAARPTRVVCLSTIGAQATTENLLTQLGIVEQLLGDLPLPVTFLRPGWFIENVQWDIPAARDTGVISSFLQPPDRKIPMVSVTDVGRTAAQLLQERWEGTRVVELEGPALVSPDDLAGTLSELLARPVTVRAIPRGEWEALFTGQGMQHPGPRMRMVDGFNEGWIRFEGEPRTGTVSLDEALGALVPANEMRHTS